ncbi:hypothetical protein D9M69_615430 [compost metagenome]
MIVRIDDVVTVVGVPGQVDLAHPIPGHGAQIHQGIKTVIHTADVDVVHIHQQFAVGFLRDVSEEVPFGLSRCGETQVA